jgi:hypothetical protein
LADELTPVEIDEAFKKRLAAKPHKQQEAIARAIVKLRQNPRHPGLRTHKLQGMPGVIAARVSQGDRLTFRWQGAKIVLLNHCSHPQVYGR